MVKFELKSLRVLLVVFLLASCSATKKVFQKEVDPSRPKKIGSLLFYTGVKNPFFSKREGDLLKITYKIKVKNLAKKKKKLNLAYSSLLVNGKKVPTTCFNYQRKQKLILTQKKYQTIFCEFRLNRKVATSQKEQSKDKVKVLLSVDGLESIRFQYKVLLESRFL